MFYNQPTVTRSFNRGIGMLVCTRFGRSTHPSVLNGSRRLVALVSAIGTRSVLKAFSTCAGVLVAGLAAQAQQTDAGIRIIRSGVTGRATFLSATDGGAIPVAPPARGMAKPIDVLAAHGQAFGITKPDRQLVPVKVETDDLGYTHTTFQQVHHGVTVFSGVIKVHQDAAGRFTSVNGDFYVISPKLNAVPTLDVQAAEAAAREALPGTHPSVARADLVIVDPGWYGDPAVGPHLAYHIVLDDSMNGVREAFFVDAHTAEIIDQWSEIHTVKNREIYNGNGGSSLPGTLARSEGDSPVGSPEDVNRAYDYYGDTYDYYFRAFGRDSVDDLGLTMVATVNSTAPTCPNAFWSDTLLQMVFCSGTVTDDIVGHELTHGVTSFSAGLIYQNQSGQLNESFSDVFGEMIDLFNGDVAFPGAPGGTPWPTPPTGSGQDTPNNLRSACSPASSYPDGVRWLLGEDATAFGGAIRDMWDPTCAGDPDFANSSLQTCPSNDNGGVHSGSGVTNHAFAMVTDGKTCNGQTVNGIGPIKAGAVWYRALTVYLTPASDFEDAYIAFNQAAADLIGTIPDDPRTGNPSADMFTAADANEVDKALLAVELNTPGACGQGVDVLLSEAPLECPQRTTVFANDFEGGVNGWTVSNSNPPTSYDWVQTSGLPFGRSGAAWFAADLNVGDCGAHDESALHSLFSPVITLPSPIGFPTLAFTHYMETEPGWDGGNIRISVNGGGWQSVPRSAFRYSPYNIRMSTASAGNTNPLAGQEGWTGAGGTWGRSVVDLSGFASAGDSLQCRFDLGKDGCFGVTGWFMDDFEVYDCPDCDSNGVVDDQDFVYSASSLILGNIGTASAQTFTLNSPPQAAGDVLLTFVSVGDFSFSTEWIDVDINGVSVGAVFALGGNDCGTFPNFGEITVSAGTFNAAVGGGNAVINMVATSDVNPILCAGESYVNVFVEFPLNADDADSNGILDVCETCLGDGDCDDGVFCNGAETCVTGACQTGTPPNCDDGNLCTADTCDGVTDQCVNTDATFVNVNLAAQALSSAVTRDVTFVVTDCQGDSFTRVEQVDFAVDGTAAVQLDQVAPWQNAEWMQATEGHTLAKTQALTFDGPNGCSATVDFTGAAVLKSGDFYNPWVSKDNRVDITDFAILSLVWNQSVDPNLSMSADATGNGMQDVADFTVIQANFGVAGDPVGGCAGRSAATDADGELFDPSDASMTRIEVDALMVPGAETCDLNADGVIDARDIRAFAEEQNLYLTPKFRAKLAELEKLAVKASKETS
ncbi:MAG: hypothetical protein GY778_14915 [bacterium]|nr:hypothetical protein [bacterium]